MRSLLRRTLPRPLISLINDVRHLGLPRELRIVMPYGLSDALTLLYLGELARRADADGIAGDFVECGVYRGASAGILGSAAVRSTAVRHLWLYDAFAGMPPAHEELDDDLARSIEGQYVGSEADTRYLMKRLEVPEETFTITSGWFDDTLSSYSGGKVALLHVDCDFYDPVKQVLEFFEDKLAPGAWVVLNDYGSFEGCRIATDDFLEKRRLEKQAAPTPIHPITEAAAFFRV